MKELDEYRDVLIIALEDKINLFRNYNSDYIEGIIDGLELAISLLKRL